MPLCILVLVCPIDIFGPSVNSVKLFYNQIMSTKCTISYDSEYHLYQECFENDNVYLRLDAGDWDAVVSTADVDWHDGDSRRPSLLLRVDVTMWRKIVEGWVSSSWAAHPEHDHEKLELDLDATKKWIDALARQKAAEKEEGNNE